MSKTGLIIIVVFICLAIIALSTVAYLKFSGEDSWLCQNGQWIKHGQPSTPQPTTACPTTISPAVNNNINSATEPEVKLDTLKANDLIISPFTFTGQAKLWHFEGSFPVKLLDENKKEISTGIAQAQADWMTENYVPFKATLEFIVEKEQTGTLVLMNDNPSGLPEFDKKMEIPVRLAASEAMTIKVFFGNETKNPGAADCTKVFSVDRKIAKTSSTAQAALTELLNGPTQQEITDKYFTSINNGVTVQKITIKGDTAYADFDKALEQNVGGSCRVAAIASQIRETLKQFSSIKNVVISIDGHTEDILQP